MVISIVNQKGGVGKSTIAVNLAVESTKNKKRVLLIDADKQASSISFRAIRSELDLPQFTANQILTPTIHKDIQNYDNFDEIIIDVGAKDTKVFRSAIISSDIIIIPIQPSAIDFWSTEDTLKIISEVRMSLPNLKIYGLLNMVMPSTKIASEVKEHIKEFEKEYQMQFLDSQICARVSFKYAFNDGIGITEQLKDQKAKKEMENLYKEISNAY